MEYSLGCELITATMSRSVSSAVIGRRWWPVGRSTRTGWAQPAGNQAVVSSGMAASNTVVPARGSVGEVDDRQRPVGLGDVADGDAVPAAELGGEQGSVGGGQRLDELDVVTAGA